MRVVSHSSRLRSHSDLPHGSSQTAARLLFLPDNLLVVTAAYSKVIIELEATQMLVVSRTDALDPIYSP